MGVQSYAYLCGCCGKAVASAFLYVDPTTCASIATEPRNKIYLTLVGRSSTLQVAVHLTATAENF